MKAISSSFIRKLTKIFYAGGVIMLVAGVLLSAITIPVSANGGNGEWDKASIYFSGGCSGSCSKVEATVCNHGSNMTSSSTWELYYSLSGEPKNGTKVASGSFGPLAKDACTTLSYNPNGVAGKYMFRAMQPAGHPGQGDAWSSGCTVNSCTSPTNPPPVKTNTPVNTQEPTATNTVQVPTATNTVQVPTATNTVQVPTATNTVQVPTATNTVEVPGDDPTPTNTVQVPTDEPTPTNTVEVPGDDPTPTNTVQVPTEIPTQATTAAPPETPEVTNTPGDPTATNTPTNPGDPTATNTPDVPGEPTATNTNTPGNGPTPTNTATQPTGNQPTSTATRPNTPPRSPTNTPQPVITNVPQTDGTPLATLPIPETGAEAPAAGGEVLIPVTGADLTETSQGASPLVLLQGFLMTAGLALVGSGFILQGMTGFLSRH